MGQTVKHSNKRTVGMEHTIVKCNRCKFIDECGSLVEVVRDVLMTGKCPGNGRTFTPATVTDHCTVCKGTHVIVEPGVCSKG